MSEIEQLRSENTILRGLLPKLGAPCAHCGLTDISKCVSGFPGCAQADDIMCADEEVGRRLIKERDQLQAQVAQLRGALKKIRRLNDHRECLNVSMTMVATYEEARTALSTPAPAMIEREKVRHLIPEVVAVLANRWASTEAWHNMAEDHPAFCGEIHVSVRDCKDCWDAVTYARTLGLEDAR